MANVIDSMTLKEAREILSLLNEADRTFPAAVKSHPMLGKRCLIRTYSAGVHIGDVVDVDGMEVLLKNAIRLWKWEGGGLSLSVIANKGIVKGRLNRTGDVYLTQAIEFLPTTEEAEKTFEKYIEE